MDRVEEIIEQFDPDEIRSMKEVRFTKRDRNCWLKSAICSTKMKVRSLKSND